MTPTHGGKPRPCNVVTFAPLTGAALAQDGAARGLHREGDDRVVGGPGADELEGNNGVDRLKAVDLPAGPDSLDGGPDTDACFSDAGDTPASLAGGDC